MPIRFRCAYCNQLLGIARRKSGTVVRCPTCAGQVVVPNQPPEAGEGPEPPVFERSDFDQVFKFGAESRQAAVAPGAPPPQPRPAPAPAGAWGTHAEPSFDVERVDPAQLPVTTPRAPPPTLQQPSAAKGIVLSPNMATLISVAVILAVALAFGAGFIVGRFLQ